MTSGRTFEEELELVWRAFRALFGSNSSSLRRRFSGQPAAGLWVKPLWCWAACALLSQRTSSPARPRRSFTRASADSPMPPRATLGDTRAAHSSRPHNKFAANYKVRCLLLLRLLPAARPLSVDRWARRLGQTARPTLCSQQPASDNWPPFGPTAPSRPAPPTGRPAPPN